MNLLKIAFESLPVAASHPFALIGYLFLLGVWATVSWKVTRNRHLLLNLKTLPARDRLEALKAEMGTVELRTGLSAEQWIRYRTRWYLLIAFIALCLVGTVVFAIAVNKAKAIEASRDELLNILSLREQHFVAAVDQVLAISWPEAELYPDESDHEKMRNERQRFIEFRDKILTINMTRKKALQDGNLVLAHELGNEIDNQKVVLDSLISAGKERQQKFQRLYHVLSKLSPVMVALAGQAVRIEVTRVAELQLVKDALQDLAISKL